MSVKAIPLHCRLNIWHRWRPFSTDDGSSRFIACVLCGKQHKGSGGLPVPG